MESFLQLTAPVKLLWSHSISENNSWLLTRSAYVDWCLLGRFIKLQKNRLTPDILKHSCFFFLFFFDWPEGVVLILYYSSPVVAPKLSTLLYIEEFIRIYCCFCSNSLFTGTWTPHKWYNKHVIVNSVKSLFAFFGSLWF